MPVASDTRTRGPDQDAIAGLALKHLGRVQTHPLKAGAGVPGAVLFECKLWNAALVNQPWVVGICSALIRQTAIDGRGFAEWGYEDWVDHYHHSGFRRSEALDRIPAGSSRDFIASPWESLRRWLNLEDRQKARVVGAKLNLYHGRTRAFLNNLADRYFQAFQQPALLAGAHERVVEWVKVRRASWTPAPVRQYAEMMDSPDVARRIIEFHVLYQTWEGTVRENNSMRQIVKRLEEVWPGLFEVSHASGDDDVNLNVDFMIFTVNRRLVCGIQVKPVAHESTAEYLSASEKEKQRKFKATHRVELRYLYADPQGLFTAAGNLGMVEVMKDCQAAAEWIDIDSVF